MHITKPGAEIKYQVLPFQMRIIKEFTLFCEELLKKITSVSVSSLARKSLDLLLLLKDDVKFLHQYS